MLPELITFLSAYFIKMNDVRAVIGNFRNEDISDSSKAFGVLFGDFAPALVVLIKVGELRREDHRLERVEPAVASDQFMHVLLKLAVIAKCPDLLRDLIILGQNHPAVACRA